LSEGDLRAIDQYEFGQELVLDKLQTDHVVDQLFDILMVQKIIGSKIILSPEAKEVDTKKELT